MMLDIENWRIQRKQSTCNFITHYHYFYITLFIFLLGSLFNTLKMNRYRNIHIHVKHCYKQYHLLLFATRALFFKRSSTLIFLINIVIMWLYWCYLCCRIMEKQSPKMVKNLYQIIYISNLFCMLFSQHFMMKTS